MFGIFKKDKKARKVIRIERSGRYPIIVEDSKEETILMVWYLSGWVLFADIPPSVQAVISSADANPIYWEGDIPTEYDFSTKAFQGEFMDAQLANTLAGESYIGSGDRGTPIEINSSSNHNPSSVFKSPIPSLGRGSSTHYPEPDDPEPDDGD